MPVTEVASGLDTIGPFTRLSASQVNSFRACMHSGIGRNGRDWNRKGLVVSDGMQSVKVSGWANDWGHQFDMAEEGDVVLLSNLELDAGANQLRGQ